MTSPAADPLSRQAWATIALTCAALVVPSFAVVGFAFGVPAFLSLNPNYAAVSPVTAIALLLLSAALLQMALRPARPHWELAFLACLLSAAPLLSVLLYGEDLVSPVVAKRLHLNTMDTARMSAGTSIAIIAVALSLLPMVRRYRQLPDVLCVLALLVAGIALLGYAYGTLDIYAIVIFHTMSLRSALAIFLLALAAITLRAQNGVFKLITAQNEAGGATRRQLLMAIAGPLLGWAVLQMYRDSHLSVGASLAIFVAITMAPLIWLILRDGRLLDDLHTVRRDQRDAATAHTRELEVQLSRQAAQLDQQSETQLAMARDAKLHSDNRYRILFQSIDAGFCVIEMKYAPDGQPVDYRFLETNAAFEAATGLNAVQGAWMRTLAPAHEQSWFDIYGEIARTQTPRRFENSAKALDDRWYDVHAFPVDEPSLHRVGILFNDVTAQRRAAESLQQINLTLEDRIVATVAEREKAQEELRQAQKMEAVGQLTGGIAHDFNNLLQSIGGSLQLLRTRTTQGRFDDAFRFIDVSEGAVWRAAALTHRLLAFSRRQTLEPKVTDVNKLMTGMEDLIRRTVGPHIALEIVAAPFI